MDDFGYVWWATNEGDGRSSFMYFLYLTMNTLRDTHDVRPMPATGPNSSHGVTMAQTYYLTSAIRLLITGATPRPSTKLVRAAHVVPTDPETILSHAGSAG